MKRAILIAAAGAAAVVLAGCAGASMEPLSSRPPVAKLTLAAPFKSSGWSGYMPPIRYSVILPAGVYQPLYEDSQAYYYQAPSKVVVNDLVSLLYDGGMYIMRGETQPQGWYYIDEDGTQTSRPFKTAPPLK